MMLRENGIHVQPSCDVTHRNIISTLPMPVYFRVTYITRQENFFPWNRARPERDFLGRAWLFHGPFKVNALRLPSDCAIAIASVAIRESTLPVELIGSGWSHPRQWGALDGGDSTNLV